MPSICDTWEVINMGSFVLFLIVAAIAYWWFIRRNKGGAEDMGKLVEHGVDIEAKVVSKTRSQRMNRYLVYFFTLENRPKLFQTGQPRLCTVGFAQ